MSDAYRALPGSRCTPMRLMELPVWPSFVPGLCIMIAVLGFNLLGDTLRDVLDPRLRGRSNR